MNRKLNTQGLADLLNVSVMTVSRIAKNDSLFPVATKIGRDKYYDSKFIYPWLQSRASKKECIALDDKIMSGDDFLALVGRSRGWLWLNVIKPRTLTRINLSPNPEAKKLINYFIEREVYETYGDLIEINNKYAA